MSTRYNEKSMDREGVRVQADEVPRKLLVLDTSFTLERIRQLELERSVTCRDLDGFFEHVWTVHPFATLLTSDEWASRHGRPVTHELAPRHSFIEGKVGRFEWLQQFFILNFLLSQFSLFLSLRQLICSKKINTIRVGSPLYLGLFGLALARITGVPLVIRVAGNYDKIFETTGLPIEPRLMRSRRIEKSVERFVFRRADLVAGANQDNLEFALANGAALSRSTLFRYGNLLDARHFADPKSRKRDEAYLDGLGITAGKFLLYVGRLEPVKHPDHVIKVLAEVRGRGFDVKAVLAGDGRMQSDLRALARSLNIEDFVIFAGNIAQGRLAELYPLAAVVLSPHTGRALSEAALGSAPVIAYDIDWQGELIETGVTGILVEHTSWQAMAEATARLLSNYRQARAFGNALRSRVVKMLDPVALDEHERQEYRKLLAQFETADRP